MNELFFLSCGNVPSETCCVPQSCCVEDFEKQAVSDRRIQYDWSDYLEKSGERAITGVTWGIFDASNEAVQNDEISLVAPDHNAYSDISRVTIRGGINGRTYRIYLRGTTCPGCVQEQVCFGLRIRNC